MALADGLLSTNIATEIRKGNLLKLNYSKYSFIQINANPILFRTFIKSFFKQNKDPSHFITYFHADELLPNRYKSKAALLLYDTNNMRDNILYLINIAKSYNMKVSFDTFNNYFSSTMR